MRKLPSTSDPLALRIRAWLERVGAAAPLVACSGGPDSLALLRAGAQPSWLVCHVDHGLRPGSEREGAFVREAALAAGVAADRIVLARLPELDARGRSLEDALREARYQALAHAAASHGADLVLTGHTATDQVETFFLHLLRGAGSAGLAGMRELTMLDTPAGRIRVGRPLLGTPRAEVMAYLERAGLRAFEDPSNADPRHLRNRVRAELLPVLRGLTPALEAVIGRAAANLASEAAALDELAALLPLDAETLLGAPRALRFRALLRAGRAAGVALETVHLPALERLLGNPRGGAGIDLPGGRAVLRRGRLRFEPAKDPVTKKESKPTL